MLPTASHPIRTKKCPRRPFRNLENHHFQWKIPVFHHSFLVESWREKTSLFRCDKKTKQFCLSVISVQFIQRREKEKIFFFLYIVIFLVKHYYIVLGRFYILYLMNTFSASIVLGTLFTVHISVLFIVHCVYSVYSGVLSIVFIV